LARRVKRGPKVGDLKTRAQGLIAAGKAKAAYRLLEKACRSTNADAETWFLFAGASSILGRFDDVISGCRRTVELSPRHAKAWYNLGLAYFKQGHLEEAISSYQSALAIKPDSPVTLGNLATAYLESGDPVNAVIYCTRAVAVSPRLLTAINTLGVAYRDLGRYQEALDYFERGVAIAPHDAEVCWNRALALLKLGDFTRGWGEFEWRWRYEKAMQRGTPYPRWSGERPFSTLMVYMEQGIGDQIMYASCLPDLYAPGDHIILECDPRLAPIFRRSFPNIQVHAGVWDERLPECRQAIEYQLPMGSLPSFFRRERASFPEHTGYLLADTEDISRWRDKLSRLGSGLKVGISWRGSTDARKHRKRSVPLFEWDDILHIEGVVYVDIQYGDWEDELEAACDSGSVINSPDGIDAMKNLDSFASLISALDLVISVDNSTLHLAGALGVESWGLLPYSSNWRWGTGVTNSLWFPSVKLFHQDRVGCWDNVLEQVRTELIQRVGQTRV